MVKLLDKSRITLFDYFYLACIVLYAGKATVFARDLGDISTIGNAFALLLSIIFFLKNKIEFGKNYVWAILVFLLYAAATSINNHMINPLWISQWLIWITIAYFICHGFKKRLFVAFETILFHLSIIGVVLWAIQLVAPNMIEQLVKTFEFSKPYTEDGNVSANMIVYTLANQNYGNSDFNLLTRNPGFAWEPGAFASMICLALFCNFLRTNVRLKGNASLWVLLIALFSTQSTTGFAIFMVMIALWVIVNKKFVAIPFVVSAIIAMTGLSFVSDKFLSEYEGLQTVDYSSTSSGSFGRMYSFQLDFEEFLRHPILGLGGFKEGTWYKLLGYEFATISGIGHLLAYYGAIMTILFFYLLIRSCIRIKKLFNTNNAFLLLVAIVGMMISYNLWEHPLYIAFWMFGVFCPNYEMKNKQYFSRRFDRAQNKTKKINKR